MSAPLSALPLVTTLTDNSRLYAFDETAPTGQGSKAILVGDARALLGGGGASPVTLREYFVNQGVAGAPVQDGSPGAPFATITAAVAAVLLNPGDADFPAIIRIATGFYGDTYDLPEYCTLQGSGENQCSIWGPQNYPASKWEIKDVTITWPQPTVIAGADFGADGTAGFTRCRFAGDVEINLTGASSIFFTRCIFESTLSLINVANPRFDRCEMGGGCNVGTGLNPEQIYAGFTFCEMADVTVNGNGVGTAAASLRSCTVSNAHADGPLAEIQIGFATVCQAVSTAGGGVINYTLSAATSLGFESDTGTGWPDPAPLTIRDALDDLSARSGGGGVLPAVSHIVHVATYGDDATADGTEAKPFLTIAAATALCAAATADAPFQIIVGPGTYPDTWYAPAYTTISGAGIGFTFLTGDSDNPPDFAFTVRDVTITGSVYVGGGPGADGKFLNVNFTGSVYLDTDAVGLYFENCAFAGLGITSCTRLDFVACKILGSLPITGAYAPGWYVFNRCDVGDIYCNDPLNQSIVELRNSMVNSVSVSGANAILNIYGGTVINSVTVGPDAVVVHDDSARALGYAPSNEVDWPAPFPTNIKAALDVLPTFAATTPGDWIEPVPTTVRAALDQLATRSPTFRATAVLSIRNTGTPLDIGEINLPDGLNRWTPGRGYLVVNSLAGVITAAQVEFWTGPNGTGTKLNGGTGSLAGLTVLDDLKEITIAAPVIAQTSVTIYARQTQAAAGTGQVLAVLELQDLTV